MVLPRSDLDDIRALFASEMSRSDFHTKIINAIYSKIEEKFNEKIKKMDVRLNKAELEIKALNEENDRLIKTIDKHEQYSKRQNVRIFGIEKQANETNLTLKSDVLDLFKNKMKISVTENDLKTVYRVKSKISVPDKPAAVVVQIDNNSVRASVFKQRKMLAKSKIIVREDLTQKTLSLLKAARNKFTSKNSWCVRGSVFVKCNNIVHRVTDQKHLDQLNSETIT